MSAVAQTEADQLIRRFIEGKREDTDTPHRDPDVLMHYYWDEEMSQRDVANELGCSKGTVQAWLKKTDIGARSQSEAQSFERATFTPVNSSGHEHWWVRDPNGGTTVGVHRLLAIADGADPREVFTGDTEVHHRTCIPWLNMPGMVEVLTPGEHHRTHTAGEWTTEDGIPVLETQD